MFTPVTRYGYMRTARDLHNIDLDNAIHAAIVNLDILTEAEGVEHEADEWTELWRGYEHSLCQYAAVLAHAYWENTHEIHPDAEYITSIQSWIRDYMPEARDTKPAWVQDRDKLRSIRQMLVDDHPSWYGTLWNMEVSA